MKNFKSTILDKLMIKIQTLMPCLIARKSILIKLYIIGIFQKQIDILLIILIAIQF